MERMSQLIGGKNIACYLSEKAADVWQAEESYCFSTPQKDTAFMEVLESGETSPSKSTCLPRSRAQSVGTMSVDSSVACSRAQYKEPQQTVLCLDWDDTLFPTTEVFKRWDPALETVTEEQEQELVIWRKALLRYLNVACELSDHVVIVTNSKYPWVQRCVERFVPDAWPLFKEGGGRVHIVYATASVHKSPPVRNAMPETEAEFDARQTRAKFKAMQQELTKFYSQYPGQSWKNVVSIGDMPYEHDALQEIAFQRDSPKRERLKTKVVTTATAPSLAYMSLMHDVMTLVLPVIVGLGYNIDLDLSRSSSVLHKLGEELQLPEIAMLAQKHAWPEQDSQDEGSYLEPSCQTKSDVELSRKGFLSGQTGNAVGLWSGLDDLETIVHSELME